jgi:hypothetical protein
MLEALLATEADMLAYWVCKRTRRSISLFYIRFIIF